MDSSTEVDMIASLTWTISPVDNGEVFCFCARTLYSPSKLDIKSSLRLIAMRLSGNMEVYTISQSLGSFKFEGPITLNKAMPNPFPDGTFVVDAKTGASRKADRQRFMDMLHFHGKESGPVVLVASGVKGVRSFLNITGECIAKVEWNTKPGAVIGVKIVERLGWPKVLLLIVC